MGRNKDHGAWRIVSGRFLPHNSAINSRFQSEFWPIFENHAIKGPAHLDILRVRGGSSWDGTEDLSDDLYSPHARR